MKPLVYWCRWHDAKLRLRGRDEGAVWGELVFTEASRAFRFELNDAKLIIYNANGTSKSLFLDEKGVELR